MLRWLFLGAFGLWSGMAVAQSLPDPNETGYIACWEAKAHGALAKSASTPVFGYDQHYARLTWQVDPAVNAIAGEVWVHFTTTMDLDELIMEAGQGLVVDEVAFQGVSIPFTHAADDQLSMSLPATLTSGTLDSVLITYHGAPAGTGFGSFEIGDHNGTPVLWTLSEPYGSKDWWPCKQDLHDKIDSIDVRVTAPIGNRVAGNGVLAAVDTLTGGTEIRYHWRHRHPIAYYLIAIAVTDYLELNAPIDLGNGTSVDMLTYCYPEDEFVAWLNAGDIAQQMPLFSDLFGTYPFADEKYGHAQFGWGGGMEHQTMSFLGGYSYELAAHELAHQWFGNKVTCGSWQDLWLNEGFATYLSGLCYDFIATQYWKGWLQARIDGITSQPGGSVHVPDTLDIDRLFDPRLTYNKGAMVLHMLRWVCGDADFFAGINAYLNDPELAFGTSRTADLQAHLEASSGLDLDEFFLDWYYGQGFPTYTLLWGQSPDGTVQVQLDQSTSHPSVPFYEMPVPVRFKNGAQDSLVILDHTMSGQTYSFWLPFLADSALLDPDIWLLRGEGTVLRVPGGELEATGVTAFPNPFDRRLDLYLGTSFQGPVSMTLTDASGRVVFESSLVAARRDLQLTLPDLADGTYLLELRSGEDRTRVRVMRSSAP
ncbi:MAG: T9SS type A sorting domain-containing protein [Flavobacteriales bacterium]|nr:T9SS type A sorting domain-containing protein [Flavobacteriales bacterium]